MPGTGLRRLLPPVPPILASGGSGRLKIVLAQEALPVTSDLTVRGDEHRGWHGLDAVRSDGFGVLREACELADAELAQELGSILVGTQPGEGAHVHAQQDEVVTFRLVQTLEARHLAATGGQLPAQKFRMMGLSWSSRLIKLIS